MNFGYNNKCKGWKEKYKWELAEELSKVLNVPIETGNRAYKNDGSSPYIEVDGVYNGVRIRRITHLSSKAHEELVMTAEKIYKKVMSKK